MSGLEKLLRFGLGLMLLITSVVFASQGSIALVIAVLGGGDAVTIPWPAALLELFVAYFAFKHAKILLWNPALLREATVVLLFVIAVVLGGQGASALVVGVVSMGSITALPWPIAVLEVVFGYWLFRTAKRLNSPDLATARGSA